MAIRVVSNHPKDSSKTLRQLDFGTIVLHEGQKCIVTYGASGPCRGKSIVSLEIPGNVWTLGDDFVFRDVLGTPKLITLEF